MTDPRRPEEITRPRNLGRFRLFTSLKTEMLLSLAVMGTAALSLAALNVIILQSLAVNRNSALYLALLIIGDVIVFVAFGAYKIQGLVLDPLDTIVETTEAIATGDLTRRVPPGATIEFARLARSVNRMTSRLLEEQAQHTHLEKVASVGRLAAGVAHEIGNPLGAISGYTHILEASIDHDDEAADALAGIERESARIDRIVRGLLDYARPRRRAAQPIDLDATIHQVLHMLTDQGALRGVQTELTLRHSLAAHAPLVGDPHELEQVLVNLLLNAIDAMQGNGTVTIITECVPFAELLADAAHRRGDPGSFAVVREQSARVRAWMNSVGEPEQIIKLIVADTGPGVPWSETERVFDPFFTTKEPGKGTGLGLAIVARVVESFGGTVWVRQAREGGAAFVMYFPVSDRIAPHRATPVAGTPGAS